MKSPRFPRKAAKAWKAGKMDTLVFLNKLADYLAKVAEKELN